MTTITISDVPLKVLTRHCWKKCVATWAKAFCHDNVHEEKRIASGAVVPLQWLLSLLWFSQWHKVLNGQQYLRLQLSRGNYKSKNHSK